MTLIAPKSRFRVMLIVITIGVQCMGQTLNEEYRPGSVQRRASNDYVYPHQQSESGIRCKADTYLVEEHRCIENENFFNECNTFALTPSREPAIKRLTILFTDGNQAVTHNSMDFFTNISIISSSNRAHTNGSLCQIVSLEVYRGPRLATEISHAGFALSNNGTLELNENKLDYNLDEYQGELYRMNLTYSGGQLPERGCLFFKVIGKTNVTESKFNCTVPGTFYTYKSECPPPERFRYNPNSSQLPTSSGLSTKTPREVANLTNSLDSSQSDSGSFLIYILVGVGAGIFTMLSLCFLFCVCTTLLCRRKRLKVSAITSIEMERRISTASKQSEATNAKDIDLHIYETPGDALYSNICGGNCLENNPEPNAMNGKAEQILECSYAIIPNDHHNPDNYCDTDKPVYQSITPKSRTRSRSGLDSIVTAQNAFYETSQGCHHEKEKSELPGIVSECPTSECPKLIPHL